MSENSTNSKLVDIFFKNQITTVATRITVPAFTMKALTLSHTVLRTFEARGIWYSGSSITNGAGSPAKRLVFFNIKPEIITANIPEK